LLAKNFVYELVELLFVEFFSDDFTFLGVFDYDGCLCFWSVRDNMLMENKVN
jgi:hypothetical protein